MSLEQIDMHEHKRNVRIVQKNAGGVLYVLSRNRAIPDIEKLSSRNFGL